MPAQLTVFLRIDSEDFINFNILDKECYKLHQILAEKKFFAKNENRVYEN